MTAQPRQNDQCRRRRRARPVEPMDRLRLLPLPARAVRPGARAPHRRAPRCAHSRLHDADAARGARGRSVRRSLPVVQLALLGVRPQLQRRGPVQLHPDELRRSARLLSPIPPAHRRHLPAHDADGRARLLQLRRHLRLPQGGHRARPRRDRRDLRGDAVHLRERERDPHPRRDPRHRRRPRHRGRARPSADRRGGQEGRDADRRRDRRRRLPADRHRRHAQRRVRDAGHRRTPRPRHPYRDVRRWHGGSGRGRRRYRRPQGHRPAPDRLHLRRRVAPPVRLPAPQHRRPQLRRRLPTCPT